ncbi:hypothetical protein DVK02_11370 [Halobellus sp. Atlit-31R]|nr:hypothetical protein DVK02_11370 [Halobellus sp. Atlit-31R]
MVELQRPALLLLVIVMTVTGFAGSASVVAAEDTATFEITDVETNTPITAGETIEVSISVTNSGNETAQKEVWFSLDQFDKDYADVELAPGESKTVTLSYVSKSDDAKDWRLKASTPDDSAERTVTIEAPPGAGDSDDGDDDSTDESDSQSQTRDRGDSDDATVSSGDAGHPDFEIVEMDVAEPITAGERLRTNITVENTGRAHGEKLVWFALDGRTVNDTIIDLPEEDETTVTLTYDTPIDAGGNWTISANTSDDVVTATLNIAEPQSDYGVQAVQTADSIRPGDQLNVTVDVGNDGDVAEPTAVNLSVDGHRIDQQPVEVGPTNSTTVQLQYRSTESTTGLLNVTVAVGNDTLSRTVTVTDASPTKTPTPATDADAVSDAASESADSTATATATRTSTPDAPASPGRLPTVGVTVVVATLLGGAVVVSRLR